MCERRSNGSSTTGNQNAKAEQVSKYEMSRPCIKGIKEGFKAAPLREHRFQTGTKPGFTLMELLVVIALVTTLAALLLPTLTRSKASAYRVKCISNLRQLGLAAQMYWDDNNGNCFRYGGTMTNGGQLYWFGWIGTGPEGERIFDASQGVLYSNLRGRGVELCPAFNYFMSQLKLKTTGRTYGYGYNLFLSAAIRDPSINLNQVRRPSETTLLADSAQINTWQAPASLENPMLEEWYYVDDSTNLPNAHFRHVQRANVVFCDGHAAPEKSVPGSLDARMPSQFVGRLRSEILVVP
jgi:prepilin-type N-terminal cleavage/methylation domain-containing protein/prepilin-type processing-associated H-X9-DG protein